MDSQSPVPVAENLSSTEDSSPADNTSIAPAYTVTIHFLQDTHVEMTRDDYEPIDKEFITGDVQTWTADDSMFLQFSTPDSAEIIVNNTVVTFPETSDQNGIYSLTIPLETADAQPNE